MNIWLWVVCGASFLCVGMITMAVVISWPRRQAAEGTAVVAEQAPMFWRLHGWVLGGLAGVSHLVHGPVVRQRIQSKLRAAGLDGAIDAERFGAAGLLAALYGAALMAAMFLVLDRGFLTAALIGAVAGYLVPGLWLREQMQGRQRRLLRQLPHYLDVLTLAIESGLNLSAALHHAVERGLPGPLRQEFQRVLRDQRAGRPRVESLHAMAERLGMPAVTSLVAALATADRQGSSLGTLLRAQAEQRRNERFINAERLAMQAPVKMLLPLVLFIFPCTFLVLFFPIASRLLREGWLQ